MQMEERKEVKIVPLGYNLHTADSVVMLVDDVINLTGAVNRKVGPVYKF
jgi:hypothetical protein